MNWFVRVIMLIMLSMAIAIPSFAQESIAQAMESVQGTRWALLVGIADYPSTPDFEIQKLRAPVKDVNALAEFLKDPEKSGFDSEHVFTLTDEQATRRNILLTFNDIEDRAGPSDMVLFYFSGHGVHDDETGVTYLIPYDHDLRDYETTCIDFDDLASKIQAMEASKVVIILDACHSGGVKIKGAKSAPKKGVVRRYIEIFQAAEGRALLLSSDESEVSWETKDNGIFTQFLLEGLNGAADADDDGIVTFTEVADYVEKIVPEYTSENFPQRQKPTRRYGSGQVRGHIPMAINWKKVNAQSQQKLMDRRNTAIFQASLEGLDQTLKDQSLQAVSSAHQKVLNNEDLTQQEILLLQEIDSLVDGKINTEEYIAHARVITQMGLATIKVAVRPTDANIKLTPADDRERIISPSSPNLYRVNRGEYILSIQRPGYKPHSESIIVEKDGKDISVNLEPLTGELRLQLDPPDAEVTITPVNVPAPDDELIGARGMRPQARNVRKLPAGTYRVMAEKQGYEPVIEGPIEIQADGSIRLELVLKPIRTGSPPPSTTLSSSRKGDDTAFLKMPSLFGGIPRPGAAVASLIVPGLGQHLQAQHKRGFIYEASILGVGVMALLATSSYNGALDDYNSARNRLAEEAPEHSDFDSTIRELQSNQEDAYDKAKSRKTLATISQIAVAVVWAVNAADAGLIQPPQQNDGVSLETLPAPDGGQIAVSTTF